MKYNFRNTLFLFSVLNSFGIAYSVPQKLYDMANMPIVDAHTHHRGDLVTHLQCDSQRGVVLSLIYNDSKRLKGKSDIDAVVQQAGGRVLAVQRDNSASPSEISQWQSEGFVGLKSWYQFNTRLSTVSGIDATCEKMAELNFPFIGMHVGDPPEGQWDQPSKFLVYQQDAMSVIRKHPNTTFIMAHSFYMTNVDSTIDTLMQWFDQCPNLNIDVANTQWWSLPNPSHDKLRNFLIDYKDRILFGTDYYYTRPCGMFTTVNDLFSTDGLSCIAINDKTGGQPCLNLPLDVLNHLFYWNASRLIPGVKGALINLGYEINDEPPVIDTTVSISPIRGLAAQPQQVLQGYLAPGTHRYVLKLTPSISMQDKKAFLAIYGIDGRIVKKLFSGKLQPRTFIWNGIDDHGGKVSSGVYHSQLTVGDKRFTDNIMFVR